MADYIEIDPKKPYILQIWDKANSERLHLERFVDRKVAITKAKEIARSMIDRPNVQVMVFEMFEGKCTRGRPCTWNEHYYCSEPNKNEEMLYGKTSLIREETNAEKRKRRIAKEIRRGNRWSSKANGW